MPRQSFLRCTLQLFALVFLGLALAPGAVAQNVNPAPSVQGVPALEVPERVFDFGERDARGEVSHDFVIHNRGEAVLEIEKVLPD